MSDQDSTQVNDANQITLSNWVDEHADALYRFALSRVKDEHAIEDVLQETFLAALRGQHSFQGNAKVRTWLIAILRLKIIDYYRHQAKQRAAQREQAAQLEEREFRAKALTAWNCEPTNTLESDEFWSTFRTCLEKLPSSLARAFMLREMDGCSPGTICEILNITSENLAVRMFRARTALRDCLDKHWFSQD